MMIRVVTAQFLATLVISAVCLFIDWVIAGSLFAGGVAAAVPNGFVAWRFAAAGARVDARVLILAEVGRWLLSVAILGGAMLLASANLLALLGAFALMHMVPVVVPLLTQRRSEPA
jgi:F0F1-type ATP synthase assembly protein I